MITDRKRYVIFASLLFVIAYIVSYVAMAIGGWYLWVPVLASYFYFGVPAKIEKFCYGEKEDE